MAKKKRRVVRRPKQTQSIVSDEIFIPNHSGMLDAGEVHRTPTDDLDPVNKKYVDDEILNQIEDGTATGQMAFWNGTKWVKTETSELFWDDTNKRFGVGTATPNVPFTTKGNVGFFDKNHANEITFSEGYFGNWRQGLDDGFKMTTYGGANGYQNRNIIICDWLYRGRDFDHDTISANPTLFIQSVTNPDTDNTQWISFTHDQTNGVIDCGKGFLDIKTGARIGDGTNYFSLATDGELSLTGTARVTRHLRVGAGQWSHGASAPTAGIDGVFPYMAFDSATDDECHYTVIVPHRLDLTVDVEFVVDWYYSGAQDNGTVCWGVEYKSIKDGEAVTGAGTTITKTSAGTHTTGQMVRTTFTTKILAANLECCDSLGLRLYRDVSGDTLATDARLINTHFHFTQNKLGKAT